MAKTRVDPFPGKDETKGAGGSGSSPSTAVIPLPDYLDYGLNVLLVGINPGLRSAALGHHYAGASNRFWKLLSDSGMVPYRLTYRDDWRLPTWGIGLTNLVARPTAGFSDLSVEDFARGRRRLLAKMRRYQPKIVAVLGVTIVPFLIPHRIPGPVTETPSKTSRPVKLGWHPDELGGVRCFVLPNPSGRNAHYTYAEMLAACETPSAPDALVRTPCGLGEQRNLVYTPKVFSRAPMKRTLHRRIAVLGVALGVAVWAIPVDRSQANIAHRGAHSGVDSRM